MSYVDASLLAGERVTHRSGLSPAYLFALPCIVAVISLLNFHSPVGWWGLALSVILAIGRTIRLVTSEFAVTGKRVIIKVGILRRRTLEMQLSKVESLAVDQSIIGRLGNFGRITVIGTGATKEHVPGIDAPLEFRRVAQTQTA